MHLALAAIARSTFDTDLASETVERAARVLAELGHEVIGTPELLLDLDDAGRAAERWESAELDALVVLQATFADSSAINRLASSTTAPLILWAFPEPRTGDRLRLNSLCGINLAAYVLRRSGRDYRWLLEPPTAAARPALEGALARAASTREADATPSEPGDPTHSRVDQALGLLRRARIGVVGEHPAGFEPCAYDPTELAELTGASVVPVPLPRLFAEGSSAEAADVDTIRIALGRDLAGVDDLDPASLEQSVRLHLGLRSIVDGEGLAAVATRCWPECFTEFGAAACTPQAMLSDVGVPATCEADVYGGVTSLIMQSLTGQPAFVADLVDLDRDSGTGVFWHCGLAPLSLADPEAPHRAALHSNRRRPLLNEFPLRPGRVTISRLSQSANETRLVIGGGEMLRAPLAFSGTAGVVRFDSGVDAVLDVVMGEGLEHHYCIGYGDVRAELHAVAARLEVDTVRL